MPLVVAGLAGALLIAMLFLIAFRRLFFNKSANCVDEAFDNCVYGTLIADDADSSVLPLPSRQLAIRSRESVPLGSILRFPQGGGAVNEEYREWLQLAPESAFCGDEAIQDIASASADRSVDMR